MSVRAQASEGRVGNLCGCTGRGCVCQFGADNGFDVVDGDEDILGLEVYGNQDERRRKET